MLHHVQRVREFAVSDRRPAFSRVSSDTNKLFRALDRVRLAFQFDPAFARRGLDAKLGFQQLQIARLVVEKLLREPRVLEMKGFSGHK